MSDIFPVFVSSTWLDLRPERDAVESMLPRMAEIKYVGMEFFGSRGETTREASLKEVGKCKLYIGIFGDRYGSGITEAEYRRAHELSLPCFIYFKAAIAGNPVVGNDSEENKARLAGLKTELRASQISSDFTSPDHLAALIVTDLHRWLMEHIFIPATNEATEGNLAIPEMNELVTGIRGLETINRTIGGNRSAEGQTTPIPEAGNVIFQIFSQAPALLSNNIRSREFKALIRERTRQFVGRDFVFNAIEKELTSDEFSSGYIVIDGEPGIGKTSLMAQLIRTKGYLHHFNIAAQNIRSTEDFLKNICAQIILSFELDYPSLPPAAAKDSGFLGQLLSEAVARRPGDPLVIIIDALDEADDSALPPGSNRLFLPSAVPDGVYFIVTTRPKHDYRLDVDNMMPISIKEDDPKNNADIEQYISNFITAHPDKMTAAIKSWGIGTEAFIKIMIASSQGNFMYLVYVLNDLMKGLLNVNNMQDIHHLPRGLKAYYQRHWRVMQSRDEVRFRDYYKPVVCALAAAIEPVTIAQILEWCKEAFPQLNAGEIQMVINDWREFLNEDDSSIPPRFRIYHNSFLNFLEKEVSLAYYDKLIALKALQKIPRFLS